MDYYHRNSSSQSYFNSFDKFELVSKMYAVGDGKCSIIDYVHKSWKYNWIMLCDNY